MDSEKHVSYDATIGRKWKCNICRRRFQKQRMAMGHVLKEHNKGGR